MKIIEGLKKIKDLKRKADDLKELVREHCAITKEYKRDRSDWIRVCSKCHKILEGETGSQRSDKFKQKVSAGLKRAYAEGRRTYKGVRLIGYGEETS